ncbi:uncharacterized protein LOC116773627 isoform X2 [Danaus plexippus]|uniref:uncharacterized protein LOC116773627 isoform X2 n=1 Tax=Danaus plexippus TaxID=13037 RepID=UPI002AB21C96|nr:uncharacterized protein LOC116773627 isoform X2 [Danaus plexippus]
MFKTSISLALVAVVLSVVLADDSDQKETWYDDYYLGDLDDKEIFQPFTSLHRSTISDGNEDLPAEIKDTDDLSSDINEYNEEKKFEDELKRYVIDRKSDAQDDSGFDDYQFEDNRFGDDNSYGDDQSDEFNPLLNKELQVETDKEKHVEASTELLNDLSKTNKSTDKDILEETKSILSEETINDFAHDKTFGANVVNDTESGHILEETRKIINENYGSIEDNIDKDGGEESIRDSETEEDHRTMITTSEEGGEREEKGDTIDTAYSDIMHDLNRLHGTWKKLNEVGDDVDDNDYSESEEQQEMDGDYEEIGDSELERIFENSSHNEQENVEASDEILSDETSASHANTYKPLPYINDALVASDVDRSLPKSTNDSSNSNSASSTEESSVTESSKASGTTESMSTTEAVETTLKSEMNEMSIAEEDAAILKFTEVNPSILDVTSSDIINATNVWLTVNGSVEVTSPDYPSPYPTNNTVDWMFQGAGQGIELNITEFSVNGYLGDYLLVKPGGVDSSGSSGLIFTYSLRTERRYRFLDVDKMFVRFVAKPGNQLFRGFKFSARMVVDRPESIPEPEEDVPAPVSPATITVNLGGISLQDFHGVEEQFRRIIADMATLYINTNDIDAGLNATREITQITRKAFCYHKWPKFELCTEVSFGVPLVYDEARRENMTEEERNRFSEHDLTDMWTSYSQRDPFAARLRNLGIAEYQIPDDKGVLALWLVVAAGVVISAALLALALWRFSCFEDYTRMPVYGDTDSLNEKRTLDLYPTPHQTLPPLFETDYKWSEDFHGNKVDAGFANSSFLSDGVFDPRAERPAARDRSTTDV